VQTSNPKLSRNNNWYNTKCLLNKQTTFCNSFVFSFFLPSEDEE
jgi:hypothetical protein